MSKKVKTPVSAMSAVTLELYGELVTLMADVVEGNSLMKTKEVKRAVKKFLKAIEADEMAYEAEYKASKKSKKKSSESDDELEYDFCENEDSVIIAVETGSKKSEKKNKKK